MTITLDQALGSNSANPVATLTITTSAAAAAGSRVVVCCDIFNATPANPSCTIGGTAATLDKVTITGGDLSAIFSLVVAGGLSSSSSIIVTDHGTGGSGGMLATAASYLGTTGVDTTSNNSTTGTSFSSGSATNSVADALFIGAIGNETTVTSVGGTNTNGTARFDIWNAAAGQGLRMMEKIATSISAQAMTGTWASTSTNTVGSLAIYKGTALAAAAPTFTPHRMPLGA